MTCHRIVTPTMQAIVCDFTHGESSAVVNGRSWQWGFHDYLGPTFYRKDGVPLANQNPPQRVWDAFGDWLTKYQAAKAVTADQQPGGE